LERAVQLSIQAIFGNQLLMRTTLSHSAIGQY